MTGYKRIRFYVGRIRTVASLHTVMLLLGMQLVGCGTFIDTFMSNGTYQTPELPKSELATLQIDTERGWVQRYRLIVLRIDGQLALQKTIKPGEPVSIDEILVAPGKHNMSLLTVSDRYDQDRPSSVQMVSGFSAEIEAGGTYLLQEESKLVDAKTNEVVSQSNLF